MNNNMTPGEVAVAAHWITGMETGEQIDLVMAEMTDYLNDVAAQNNVFLGPPRVNERKPYSEGYPLIPPPPPHVQGPDVRCLIMERDVLAFRRTVERETFTGTLTKEQLDQGRAYVRKALKVHGIENWDDPSVDMYINELPGALAARICGLTHWLGKQIANK